MSAIPAITIVDFEAGNIDPDRFDHESHVYMGWLYVSKFGLIGALEKFDSTLFKLALNLGVKDKYHRTVTWFFLILIAERVADGEDWPIFRRRNADVISNGKTILSQYYSDDTLFSQRARERFLLPDNLAASTAIS